MNRCEQEIAERKSAEERVQSQLGRLELLHRITRAISERQDLKSIFQVVIRTLEEHLPLDFSCVCLYDPGARVLNIASIGIRSEALATELAETDIRPRGYRPERPFPVCRRRIGLRTRHRPVRISPFSSGSPAMDCIPSWPRRFWWKARFSACSSPRAASRKASAAANANFCGN